MILTNARILSYKISPQIKGNSMYEDISYNIHIKNGKFFNIKPSNTDTIDINSFDSKDVIDLKEAYVTPGLIDAHTHLGMKSDSSGVFFAEHNEPNSLISSDLRAIDAINPLDRTFKEAREAGITTCASGPGSANLIGGQYACIKTYGTIIDDMILDPYIGMKVALGENPKKRYDTTRMGIAGNLRKFLREATSYKESLHLKNSSFDSKLNAMLPIIRREKPLKIHAHRADDIVTAIRICEEFNVKYTLDHVTCGVDVLDYLESKDAPLLVGPSLGSRGKAELHGKGFDSLVTLSRNKEVSIITDAPVIPLQYLPICAGLGISKGMDYNKALRAVTINPAKVMGVENRVGSIEIGKDADLVVWKSKPFITIQDPLYVIIDGNIIKECE